MLKIEQNLNAHDDIFDMEKGLNDEDTEQLLNLDYDKIVSNYLD
jgi:hypothetical protein